MPSYTTDLTTLAEAVIANDTGVWAESSNASWDDQGGPVEEVNFYIEGVECVSAQATKTGVGSIIYGHGSAIGAGTDGAFLVWGFWASPPSLQPYDTATFGGMTTLFGNDYDNMRVYKASGSDFEPNPIGGWYCYAADPTLVNDYSMGTAVSGSTFTHIGIGYNVTAQARGNPIGVDAIRYGRCESRYDGTVCLFSGFSAFDNTNKYGLFQLAYGSYSLQGKMLIGSITAATFTDSNASIVIANTPKVSSNFNLIEIQNATTTIDWTAVSFSALGTVSKGRFLMTDNATVNKTSCTFTDMDSFIYLSNATLTNSIYRRCGIVTQGSAVFDSCTFDNPTGLTAVTSDVLNNITDCTFNSNGSGHAVDLPTQVTVDTTLNWSNSFTGYGVTGTTDAVLKVDVASGITLTINSSAGTPSYLNVGAGSVVIAANQVTFTLTVKDTDGAIIQNAIVYVTADAGGGLAEGTVIINKALTNASGQVSDTRSLASDQPIIGRVRKSTGSPFYKTATVVGTINSTSGLGLTIQMISDE